MGEDLDIAREGVLAQLPEKLLQLMPEQKHISVTFKAGIPGMRRCGSTAIAGG